MEIMDKAIDYIRIRVRKTFWLFNNRHSKVQPVFIFGVQRSGTTMLGTCLSRSVEIEHYPESDERAYEQFILRDASDIQSLIDRSRYSLVIFKPLTDSHRVTDILDTFVSGKSIWMYRNYRDRIQSSLAKFGDHNLELMKAFAKGEMLDTWQAKGVTELDLDFIRSCNPESMTAESAAALFWYMRNKLYFSQSLDIDARVLPVSYEALAQFPHKTMNQICQFLGCQFTVPMIDKIHPKSINKGADIEIAPIIESSCQELYENLEAIRLGMSTRDAE